MTALGLGAAIGVVGAVLALLPVRLFPPAWSLSRRRVALILVLITLVSSLASALYGPVVAGVGVTLGALLGGSVLAWRSRRAWSIENAVRALDTPDAGAREAAAQTLRALLDAGRGLLRRHAFEALYVGRKALAADEPALALEVVRPLLDAGSSAAPRTPTVATAAVQLAVAAHLALGDRTRARALLSTVPRPATGPMWEASLRALEILLDAIEGDASRAEREARAARAHAPHENVRWTLDHALAHALAAQGRADEARACLTSLASETKAQGLLRRIARVEGPASPLARDLLGPA